MPDLYPGLKILHIACAALSLLLFLWRGSVLIITDQLPPQRWLRRVPHVVDTVLLASGITLAVIIHQYPGVNAWLTAKILALFLYIGIGLVALRFAHSRSARSLAFVAAVATFAYIIGVALAHNPLSWIAA